VRRNAELIAGACRIAPAAGAVQSIPVGTPGAAVRSAGRLRDAGILVGCFRPPSVPDGISRLRVTASAGLDPDQASRAARLIASVIASEKQHQ